MSPRFQAIVTILVGGFLVVLGGWWVITIACCSGRPREAALAFAALGLAIVTLGTWSLSARAGKGGFLRRNSLWTTLVVLTVATGVLAHVVLGVHRVRTFEMTWEESPTTFGERGKVDRGGVVLSFESGPDYSLRIDDERLAAYLRMLPDHRVEATFDLTYVFGRMEVLRLVRAGEMSSPVGFGVTSGVRGKAAGPPPWD